MGRFENRRPPRWSIGEAVGTALQGGGQFFGALAVEKLKAENLQAARSARRAEKSADREVALGDRDEQRSHAATLLGDKQSRADALLAKADSERDSSISTRTSMRGADVLALMGDDAPENINPEGFYKVAQNKEGAPMGVFEDTDFGEDGNGEWGKLSAGTKTPTSATLADGQRKVAMHVTTMKQSRKEVEDILGAYDLGSTEAFGDRVAGNVPFGNYLQSSDGQKFTAATARLTESIFKAESGAAGSDAEAARYRSFIPQAGDSPETAAMKFRILDATMTAYEEASGRDWNQNDASQAARNMAHSMAAEANFAWGTPGAQVGGSANSLPTANPEHDAADAGLNSKFGNTYMNSTD